MTGSCELCGKIDELEACLYMYEEKKMLCRKCWDNETARGDWLYEQWKEREAEERAEA